MPEPDPVVQFRLHGEPPRSNAPELSRQSIAWLARLPRTVRPIELGRHQPEVIEFFSACWPDTRRVVDCAAALAASGTDAHGHRLEPRVLAEIESLLRYLGRDSHGHAGHAR